MSILDRMIQYQATKKSPLEMLKDRRREVAADQLKRQQVAMQSKLQQMQINKMQAETAKLNKIDSIQKSMPTGATATDRAKIWVQAGLPDRAQKVLDVAETTQKIDYYKTKDTQQKRESELKETEEIRKQQEEARKVRTATREDERLALAKDIEERQRKAAEATASRAENAASNEEERLQIARDQANRQAIAAAESTRAASVKLQESNIATVKQAIGKLVPMENVGTRTKPKQAPAINKSNLARVEQQLLLAGKGTSMNMAEQMKFIQENYTIIPPNTGSRYGIGGIDEGLIIPNQFIAKAKSFGMNMPKIIDLFEKVTIDVADGQLSVDVQSDLARAGFNARDVEAFF